MTSIRNRHRSCGTVITSVLALSSLLASPTHALFGPKKIDKVKPGTKYEQHDPVYIMVNKVGPFFNPTETYRYYSLPFCDTHASHGDTAYFADALIENHADPAVAEEITADIPEHKGDRVGGIKHKLAFGEKLAGDHKETSPYEITFKDEIKWRPLCEKTLSIEEVHEFKEVINNDWFFEMYVEDLPMWGYFGDTIKENLILGENKKTKTYLYPHYSFKFSTNENNIVAVQVKTDKNIKVELGNEPVNVHFSYSVDWIDTPVSWENRMSFYDDSHFNKATNVHWLSIINDVVLVLLLVALLVLILVRILKRDFVQDIELGDDDIGEENSGWKLIHGDVFRFPKHVMAFASAVGAGVQLLITALAVFGLALLQVVSTTRRGSIIASFCVLYCLFSFVGGYVSTRLYIQLGGKTWAKNILFTTFIFPAPTSIIFFFVNSLALSHRTTAAVPYGTCLALISMFAFGAFPLTVFGGILAKNFANLKFDAPTRTNKVAREIPTEYPWFQHPALQAAIAAIMPFSAIYIEVNYIFESMWGHQIYTMFGLLSIAVSLMIVVTSMMTVAMLYFQLSREDHRWWWTTFFHGGSIAIMIYFYCFIYYFYRSEMSGILQGTCFFGYMLVICYGFFLITGAAAFCTSLTFVKFIYSRVKCD